MKSPFLIFALKCSVIMYFAACTGINEYTTAVSATPQVTKGQWKVNLFNPSQGQSNDLTGYTLTFISSGKLMVVKDGKTVNGNWSEDEILKRMTIDLDTNDPNLKKLNDQWNVSMVTKTGISLQNSKNPTTGRLQITSL